MTLASGDDTLETERLIMRRLTREDLPFLTRLHGDTEVARYIGQGRPRSEAESGEWIESTLRSYALVQLGQLAVIRKSDKSLIGRCGLSHLEVEAPPFVSTLARACQTPGCMPAGIQVAIEPELGYTFDTAVWGQGYAREATGRIFDYATRDLGLTRIVSLIHPDNARSLRLAERFGVDFVDQLRTGDMVFNRYLWRVAG